jgi:hypothetical protein
MVWGRDMLCNRGQCDWAAYLTAQIICRYGMICTVLSSHTQEQQQQGAVCRLESSFLSLGGSLDQPRSRTLQVNSIRFVYGIYTIYRYIYGYTAYAILKYTVWNIPTLNHIEVSAH